MSSLPPRLGYGGICPVKQEMSAVLSKGDILHTVYGEVAPRLRVSLGVLNLDLASLLCERANVAGLRPWCEAEMI